MAALPHSTPYDESQLLAICERFKHEPGPLLQVLHAVQDCLGHVPTEAVPRIAEALNLSRAEIHGVISFYHYFRQRPVGRHVLQICRAESCQAMGSRTLESHAQESLGIDFHETSADGQFTLLPVYCLGNCACSPSVRIADATFGHVDCAAFDRLIADLSADSEGDA